MKRVFSLILTGLFIALSACKTVPITGRKQMNLVPDAMLNTLAFTTYDAIVKNSPTLSNTDARAQEVTRVGVKIQQAVETYLQQNNLSKDLKNFKWAYHTVDNQTVNAWCMPGGKVMVYTGLFPYTQNENALAVVMGHEIAHAIARHGNERMSQSLLINLGGLVLQEALKEKKAETQALFVGLYMVGSNLALSLPNSRMHESEADRLGLIFAAMAGYNIDEAIPFWQRMNAGNKNKMPEFLSTHPSDETRIKKLTALIPEIKNKYMVNLKTQ
ncbi:putative Zn-dependent protease [Pedobacter africanus]|uniref:Zn-dependent protease n=1 Tax=Pedobacter africanus TaxID=151894 RepID=A0ACC6L0B1_9SPHI|nr:M48 family metallopeptidase [Pedobacter africanus]MDR6784947.1 putative Zn-dependent protease [Pedobacter africanus]